MISDTVRGSGFYCGTFSRTSMGHTPCVVSQVSVTHHAGPEVILLLLLRTCCGAQVGPGKPRCQVCVHSSSPLQHRQWVSKGLSALEGTPNELVPLHLVDWSLRANHCRQPKLNICGKQRNRCLHGEGKGPHGTSETPWDPTIPTAIDPVQHR